MTRYVSCLVTTAAVVLAAACDTPTAPQAAPDFDPEPHYLIGGSPLEPVTLDIKDETQRALGVKIEVTRGLTEVAASDRFGFRVTAAFSKGGTGVVGFIMDMDLPAPDKADEIRKGTLVPITLSIPIDDEAWVKILGASRGPGDLLDVSVRVELMLLDATGKAKVLDTVIARGSVDPYASR